MLKARELCMETWEGSKNVELQNSIFNAFHTNGASFWSPEHFQVFLSQFLCCQFLLDHKFAVPVVSRLSAFKASFIFRYLASRFSTWISSGNSKKVRMTKCLISFSIFFFRSFYQGNMIWSFLQSAYCESCILPNTYIRFENNLLSDDSTEHMKN